MKALKIWLPLGLSISLLCSLIYLVGQQNLRQSANDPQIQLSQEITEKLSTGLPPDVLIGTEVIDIEKSLSPYIVVYDENGMPLATSAKLDGYTPLLPSGVFAYTREHGQNRVTWQPKPGVRSAIVVAKYSGGFVMVGRSLKEVEQRQNLLLFQIVVAWFVIGGLSLILTIYLNKKEK